MFFLLSSFCVSSCAQPQVQNDFYLGLLSITNSDDNAGTVKFFENALLSPNKYVRQAAAGELAGLMYEGTELSAKTTERVKREASGYWAAAFDAVGKNIDKEKALAFLLGFEQGSSPDEARLYVLGECEKQRVSFSENELAAINGHFAVSRSRYNEALIFFRGFQEEGQWQQTVPLLFFKYPVLVNDLGRAFQYTSSGNEGRELFLSWEKNLSGGESTLRFSLLFFAARIAHRRGNLEQGISLFERAWLFAPDSGQADACIWYILDSSFSEKSGVFIQKLEQFYPYLIDKNYFNDILEKFLQTLVSEKEWKDVIRTFEIIQKNGASVPKAGYSWVIARAIEEGYLSRDEMRLASDAVNAAQASADIFMNIAYNAGDTSFYYRSQSAASLEKVLLELADAPRAETENDSSQPLKFLIGFFNNNAAEHSLRYLRQLEKELSFNELRAVAQALSQAGMYPQSMRLVSLYINKDGYIPDRRDMELFFPCPFKELIEKRAFEAGISPALLYGLIRTESAFQSGVVSRVGAVGLTQLMPETARETAGRIRRSGGPDYLAAQNEANLIDPDVNIHIGSFYLNYLIERFNNTTLALLAYNGGMNRVRRWYAANSLPVDLFLETVVFNETRNYGRKVIAASAVYEYLYYR